MISEKHNTCCGQADQVVFRVLPDATAEIGEAVASLFKVEVTGVQVLNAKGKIKRAGRVMGRRDNWKKAYVTPAGSGHRLRVRSVWRASMALIKVKTHFRRSSRGREGRDAWPA